ncbi:sugar ABC transporter ATP-binding protein [Microbacterium sp. DT81.1]|uniref:sugar ABC transporter ATP-binding protein n=1 Tax=Microbacterium sp. DT81.1 TaxID=3393413 RepID=UPI003CEC6CB6
MSMQIPAGSSVALAGRNGAGKSTLISVITGVLRPDEGVVEFGSAAEEGGGVGCVYQKSTLVPDLTAAENLMINAYPRSRWGGVDWRKLRQRGAEILDEWDCAHLADTLVNELEPVDRKIVEICRVLSHSPSVLLLDEPTAGLDYAGAQRLFAHVREARSRGVSLLYVSHHLDEAFDVCDRTTVLRDGRVVLDCALEGLSVSDIVGAMVGDAQATERVERPSAFVADAAPVLSVESITVGTKVKDVSFDVRPGECVGIAGLDGAGHVQAAQVLCGLVRPDSGSVTVAGKRMAHFDVGSVIAAGIGFTPEDRHDGGYVPAMSVAENATLPELYQLTGPTRTIRPRLRDRLYSKLASEWSVKASGPNQPVEELSGGNQQKIVLARAVSSKPSALVLVNPTAGVDVSSKRSIYNTVKTNAENGMGVIVVSADDEDFSICHRVIVMFRGEVSRELVSPFTAHELTLAIQGASE